MNTERLTKLAEWLEAGATHERITFDMQCGVTFNDDGDGRAFVEGTKDFEDCRTTCCIAGAAVQFFADQETLDALRDDFNAKYEEELTWTNVFEQAADLLGLSYQEAEDLFTPDVSLGGTLKCFSDPAWAARTIRHLISTGEVDWEATAQ
jgi:hypothetical protein